MIEAKEEFMLEAIKQAELAKAAGDYAVGAVLVKNNQIVASAGNQTFRDESPIAHAEALVVLEAAKKFGTRHLNGCVLYTTHEPCPMCASLAVWARLQGVVFGARNQDMMEYGKKNLGRKFLWRTIDISCEEVLNKATADKIDLIKDFMREECIKLFHNE
jgi:tRNA(Arg) A34 adenosine deaminase TadA